MFTQKKSESHNYRKCGGDMNQVYLLITTEFKRVSQELGKLDDFSKKIGNVIVEIDDILINEIDKFKLDSLRYPESPLVDEIKTYHNEIHILQHEIQNIIIDHVDINNEKFNFEQFSIYLYNPVNRQEIVEIIGERKYNVIISTLNKINITNMKKKYFKKNASD
jgi:hypothetical protein